MKLFCGSIAAALLASSAAFGQAGTHSPTRYLLGTVAGPNLVVGSYIAYDGQAYPPSNYSIEWSIKGTAPAACTLRPQGTSDPTDQFYSFTSIPDQDCTKPGKIFIIGFPVIFFQLISPTYTPGDQTTVVTVRYNRGGTN